MNIELASKISSRLWAMHEELNEALREIKAQCNEEEFKWYRRQFAEIMGTINIKILEVIYKEHPHLMPAELAAELRKNVADDGEK